jgi:hypothetical protein
MALLDHDARRTALRLACCLAAILAAGAASAQVPVNVENLTYQTRCAEEDNVFVRIRGTGVGRFRVAATHPAYIRQVVVDNFEPDFTDCHFTAAPPPEGPFFTPRQFVLWENAEYRMVGNTDQHFWRKRDVPVRVGDRVEHDVHLIQFYRKRPEGGRDQVVVLYPVDGHWRLKPLPMPHLDYNVYGASMLLGPLEDQDRRRPFVDIESVTFHPETLTFALRFGRGGSASVRVADVTRETTALDVVFDRDVPADRPIAALRSMFVADDVSDVADVLWRASGEEVGPVRIDRFPGAVTESVAFRRPVMSRRNTSAPDTSFGPFLPR